MNLHGIVSPIIAAVNPTIFVTVRVSTGYSTADDGSRVPTYTDYPNTPAQVQALQYSDIQQLDALQINGERRAFYLNGRFDSLNRSRGTGGDLIVIPAGDAEWPYGATWKIAIVAEQWPNWCKCLATLQVG